MITDKLIFKNILTNWASDLSSNKILSNFMIDDYIAEMNSLINNETMNFDVFKNLSSSRFFTPVPYTNILPGDIIIHSHFDNSKGIRVAIVEEKLPNDKLSYFIVTSDEDEKLLKKIGDVEALKKTTTEGLLYNGCLRLDNLDSIYISDKRRDIINSARLEIGNSEKEDKSTKYGLWYKDKLQEVGGKPYEGMEKDQWCGMFVSYIYLEKCQIALESQHKMGFAKTIGSWSGLNKMRSLNSKYKEIKFKSGEIPKPGDIVFFSFSHVGIISEYSLNSRTTCFKAIEGNTSNSNLSCTEKGKLSNNGFTVWERSRSLKNVEAIIRVLEID